jgi:SAM-dependent methyltransferase
MGMRGSFLLTLILPVAALAQPPFQPYEGQPGKDVVWVPTPPALVEKMLDLVRVTAKDFVVDLGSGDGRNVIAAAKRGARALGVEYDPEMVKLSQQNAEAAGVADKAKFMQGDMFEADFSQATVLALFLLPANLDKLRDKFLQLPAGTRIVNNGYKIHGWEEAEIGHSDGFCTTWCTAYLYIVPAMVAGAWHLPAGEILFDQDFQTLSGTLRTKDGRYLPVRGSVSGERIRFSVGLDVYTGRVRGQEMSGDANGAVSGYWKAARLK